VCLPVEENGSNQTHVVIPSNLVAAKLFGTSRWALLHQCDHIMLSLANWRPSPSLTNPYFIVKNATVRYTQKSILSTTLFIFDMDHCLKSTHAKGFHVSHFPSILAPRTTLFTRARYTCFHHILTASNFLKYNVQKMHS